MKSSDSIWALVCDRPSALRKSELFVFLRAYIDDSANRPEHGPYYVLAGYISTAERWARFSDAWAAELAEPPGVEMYKASQAARLKGRFDPANGWTEKSRQALEMKLASIVTEHAGHRIAVVMEHAKFEAHVRSLPVPIQTLATQNPYVWMFSRILTLIGFVVRDCFEGRPCEVIFDQQEGMDLFALSFWDGFQSVHAHHGIDKCFSAPPSFKDSRHILPLQAADMLAYYLAKEGSGRRLNPEIMDQIYNSVPNDFHEMGDQELGKISNDLNLRAQLGQILHPDRPLHKADAGIVKGETRRYLNYWSNRKTKP